MLLSLVFFISTIILRTVKCDDSLILNSINEDTYNYFTSYKCIYESDWKLVSYETLNITSFKGNNKGLLAAGNVCATYLPIAFFNGTLEVTVYVQAISIRYNLLIDVCDEYDNPILIYRYGSLSDEFTPGWQRIFLKINSQANGYINIRGRSTEGETIVLDTFRYIPDVTKISNKFKRSINHVSNEEAVHNIDSKNTENIVENYNGNNSGTNESFWNPFTIFFVAFASFFGLVFIIVCGYHLGKIKNRKNDDIPSTFIYDFNLPRTITIPRPKVVF